MGKLDRKERKRERKRLLTTNMTYEGADPCNRYAYHNDLVYHGCKKDKDGRWISETENDIHNRIILYQISSIDLSKILWNRDDTRQYEFDLEPLSKTFGLYFLYNKSKENWFAMQDGFEIVHSGRTQKVPITFETLSKMTLEEQMVIYKDLD